MGGERAEESRSKHSFNTVAATYARFRRGAPREVFDRIVAAGHLAAGSRVLEIGCATGQVSVPLAALGVELTAVELGPDLAAIARRNLAPFPNARVDIGAFEDHPVPERPFDAVVAAVSFHWLDPAVRGPKAARALRCGGRLVVVHPHHVAGGTAEYFRESHRFYLKWGLSDDPLWAVPEAADMPWMYPELDQLQEFSSVTRERIDHTASFTTEDYVGLLGTDSLVLTLAPPARAGFLRDIAALIDDHFGGRIDRRYLYEIVTATRGDR